MNHLAKHTCLGLAVILGLSAIAAAQSVETKHANVPVTDMNAQAQIQHLRQLRESLADDPFRPLYHFSPPGYGIHDVAGLCAWQGKYHLFYLIVVPGVPGYGRGHAVSDDLVHWQDLPVLPKRIFGGTGQAWADKDRVILSTGFTVNTTSDPMAGPWKQADPMSLKSPRPQGKFGDNCLWREGDYYYVVTNGELKHTSLEIKRSKDLAKWESMGIYFEDTYFTDPGTDCSCPNVLPIGNGKHLLLFFSHNQGSKYYIGTSDVEQGRFTIEEHGRAIYGPIERGSLHAPSAFVDPKGRCIAMWNMTTCLIRNGGVKKQVYTLARQLALSGLPASGMGIGSTAVRRQINPLSIKPIEELKTLRFNPAKVDNMVIPANGEKILPGINGQAMELEVVIHPQQAREVGLRVLRSPNGEEQTTISLSTNTSPPPTNNRELMVDLSQTSLSSNVGSRTPEIGPLFLKNGEPLRLRVFIDRSIIEVFANDRQCLTVRVYPTRSDSTQVSVFARGNQAKLVTLNAYQMRSIWPELKHREGQ